MKITKSQLKQIIKEEISKALSENDREFKLGAKVRPVKDHYLRDKKSWGTVVELPWNVKSTAHPDHIAVTWHGSENSIDFETDKPYAHLYMPDELEPYVKTPEV